MVIYKIVNKINGKCYVGQTVRDFDYRMYWHIYSARTGPTSYIHRAIRKYGIQSFEFCVIDTASSKEILNEKETYWIRHLNSRAPDGYNMTNGGNGGSTNEGKPHTAETIRKMSEQKKGDKNPFFRKQHSDEVKRNLSKILKGNKHLLGHKHSEETRKKMSQSHRKRLGKPSTDEENGDGRGK